MDPVAGEPELTAQRTAGYLLTANVDTDIGEAIDELAKRHRTTVPDVIQHAVSAYKSVDDEKMRGGRIIGEKGASEPELAAQRTAGYRRLSINVAADVGQAIDELAKRHRTTRTDVIRRAVSVYKFVDDEQVSGRRIMVERNGEIREVRFLLARLPGFSPQERRLS